MYSEKWQISGGRNYAILNIYELKSNNVFLCLEDCVVQEVTFQIFFVAQGSIVSGNFEFRKAMFLLSSVSKRIRKW